jgi:hypothetical protein
VNETWQDGNVMPTSTSKNLVKLPLNALTNGDSTFYLYLGFGIDQKTGGTEELNNKVVLLPDGWDIYYNLDDVDTSAIPHPSETGKFSLGMTLIPITSDNFSSVAPLNADNISWD